MLQQLLRPLAAPGSSCCSSWQQLQQQLAAAVIIWGIFGWGAEELVGVHAGRGAGGGRFGGSKRRMQLQLEIIFGLFFV